MRGNRFSLGRQAIIEIHGIPHPRSDQSRQSVFDDVCDRLLGCAREISSEVLGRDDAHVALHRDGIKRDDLDTAHPDANPWTVTVDITVIRPDLSRDQEIPADFER